MRFYFTNDIFFKIIYCYLHKIFGYGIFTIPNDIYFVFLHNIYYRSSYCIIMYIKQDLT